MESSFPSRLYQMEKNTRISAVLLIRQEDYGQGRLTM